MDGIVAKQCVQTEIKLSKVSLWKIVFYCIGNLKDPELAPWTDVMMFIVSTPSPYGTIRVSHCTCMAG